MNKPREDQIVITIAGRQGVGKGILAEQIAGYLNDQGQHWRPIAVREADGGCNTFIGKEGLCIETPFGALLKAKVVIYIKDSSEAA